MPLKDKRGRSQTIGNCGLHVCYRVLNCMLHTLFKTFLGKYLPVMGICKSNRYTGKKSDVDTKVRCFLVIGPQIGPKNIGVMGSRSGP